MGISPIYKLMSYTLRKHWCFLFPPIESKNLFPATKQVVPLFIPTRGNTAPVAHKYRLTIKEMHQVYLWKRGTFYAILNTTALHLAPARPPVTTTARWIKVSGAESYNCQL